MGVDLAAMPINEASRKKDREMAQQKQQRRSRQIPWLPVVHFHKAIAARAESSFFSINARDANAERWSSLQSFEPSCLAGPWGIQTDQVTSTAFRLAVDQGTHESVYLGGPCYLGWEKGMNGQWIPQWRPILYREVRLLQNSDGIEIIPDQGKWNLSPLVGTLIETLQISAGDDLGAFVAKVIESAQANADENASTTLSRNIKNVLINLLPDLREPLSKEPDSNTFSQSIPSPWVLFAPTTNFSALTRYLMADYERLETLLAEKEEERGGLVILDDGTPKSTAKSPKVMPLIPLNKAQHAAVARVLGHHPLTVISGPPGCGKSQVVVSILLNAWANGTSVLFASNNNKAVDVVRERLEKFESEFPIAVRAGNRQKNNIVELLRRTINYAGDTDSDGVASLRTHREHSKVLLAKRKDLESRLAGKLPQRAHEGLLTALHAYAEHQRKHQEIKDANAALDAERKRLDLARVSYEEIAERHKGSREWVERLGAYNVQERKFEEAKATANQQITSATRERNEQVSSIGLDPSTIDEWGWLVDGPSSKLLGVWEEKMEHLIATPIEDALEPYHWEDGYSRWSNAKEADSVSAKAKRFADLIRTRIAELAPRVRNITTHLKALEQSAVALHEHGLEEHADIPIHALRNWSNLYSSLIGLPASRVDFLPWSLPSKTKRKLKKLETMLRPHIPLAKWREIGTMNQTGRDKLSESVELLRVWKEALDRWDALEDERASVEDIFASMRAEAGALDLPDIPHEADPDEWKAVVNASDTLSRYAAIAAIGWTKKVEREKALAQIDDIARSWKHLASGHPLKETWSAHSGKDLVVALETVQREPTPEHLVAARSAYYAGALKALERAWTNAMDAQQSIAKAADMIRRIPSREERVHEWYSERPAHALVFDTVMNDWPDVTAAMTRLNAVQGLLKQRGIFLNDTQPRLLADADKEYRWAIDKLKDAIAILPPSEACDRLTTIYKDLKADAGVEWPVDEISEGFQGFSPETIKAQLDYVSAELEKGAFDDAKAAWLNRLRDDEEALNAVDQLERALRRQRGQIAEAEYDLFRTSLRLVPIWITTAQAAQAIPLLPNLFDLVIIDEASQCTLTNLLPLLYRGKRLAIIGDSEQLPAIPTIRENEELALARKYEVEDFLSVIGHASNDVYSVAADALPRGRAGVVHLTEHFRSNPQIIGFSNRNIYQQRLSLKIDPAQSACISIGSGVHRVHVNGQVSRGDRGKSWKNVPEAEKVMETVRHIVQHDDIRHLSIGIVTPFASQKEFLRTRLQREGLAGEILVDSAYGFQGDERDIILFSAVVSQGITGSASRWVESPPNLINVALTRARQALFVIADFDYCQQQDPSGVLFKMANYCKDIQLLRDTSPAELELYSWMIVEGWNPDIHPRIGDIEIDFMLKDSSGIRWAIEVDGQEYHDETQTADRSRDAYLQAQGCRVYRTPARAVLQTPYAVIHDIKTRLQLSGEEEHS
jgi:hypothetical protein